MKNEDKLLIENSILKVRQTMSESEGDPASEVWVSEVWRLDEMNLNGRTYTTELAQRLVAEGARTMAYDGHEADFRSGNDYAPAIAYCDNPRIEDRCLVVDIHFLESQKDSDSVRNIRELFKAGLPIGVSSVGYGSIDQNGVVQEDYELVRYLDFVAMPAGLVYAAPKTENSKPEPEADPVVSEPVGEPDDPEMSEAVKARARACFAMDLSRRRKS